MPGARRVEDLFAYQLAVQVRDLVLEFTSRGRLARDVSLCGQLRKAARSAPSNLSEGFVKFGPKEFARYVNVAKGSLAETLNHLRDARTQGYLNDEDFTKAWRLACRALRATSRLHQYLRSCDPRRPTLR